MFDETLRDNNIKKAFLTLLILLSLFLLTKTLNELKISGTIGRDANLTSTISVSGEGEVSAVPDIATFTFTVSEKKIEISTAQDVVSEKVSKILDSLEDLDIDDKDIKTLNYNVYPRYEYVSETIVCVTFPCPQPPRRRILTGYEVSETISVKLRDIDKAGDVLNMLGDSGVTNLNGPNFEIEDIEDLEREARKKAIDQAKKKAKELAKDLGVKLSRVVNFSENGVDYGFRVGIEALPLGIGGDNIKAVPEIPTGENKVFSRVNIVYEIR